MTIAPQWIPLLKSDGAEVDRIAKLIHPTLPERKEVLLEKIRLFPGGCFKFVFNGQMAGYGISHPWALCSVPPLDDFLRALPANPDCIYIHDVAVLPEARGHTAAGKFIEKISAVAKRMHIKRLACVSVYGTHVLWARFGFRITESCLDLATYGDRAKYMIADLSQ